VNSYDYVVIGAGSVGAHVFSQLARSGAGSVLVVDQYTPAYSRTAVGGDTRLFRMTVPEGSHYHQILMESLVQWESLNDLSGRAVYERTGCLYVGPSDSEYMTGLFTSVAETGVECFDVSPDAMARDYPQYKIYENDVAAFDPVGGFLRTDLAVQSAVSIGVAHGGHVIRYNPVRSIRRYASGGWLVTTADGPVYAGDVIVTAGAWSKNLVSQPLAELLEIRRSVLTWFGTERPDLFTPEVFPVFKRVTPDINIFGAPSTDGTQIKLSLAENMEVADADDLNQSLEPYERARAIRAVEKGFNFVTPDVVRCDAFPDMYTADHKPMIGRDPETGAYLALGLSGKGFKMSAGIGALVAREILNPGASIDALGFADPARFLTGSAPVGSPDLPEFENAAPSEAELVR
jgi:sarcosine oxidase